MRRLVRGLVMLLVLATPLQAQNLRATVEDVFRLSGNACGEPLCLNISQTVHGEHFVPSLKAGQANLLNFLSNSIAVSVANVPISAASSGATFSFQGGVPVRTSVSAGPIFSERAQTLGRRRMLIGANASYISFQSLRGVPTDRLVFNFTHEDAINPGLGDPGFENDIINVQTSLDVNVFVTTFFATFGLLDRVDLGVAVPLIHTSITGRSSATMITYGPDSPHYFGSPENPVLNTVATASGSATGIGDVAARLKINVTGGTRTSFAVLTEARMPTGDEENFLGTGDVAVRGLGILSSRLGAFSPHVNAGYVYRGGDFQTDGLLANVGFDQLVASWATFAADVISEWQVGENQLPLPGPVQYTAPQARTINPTIIPEVKDNRVDASIGFKLTSERGFSAVANALVPMNRGGLRADVVWTAGVEYGF